jgi:hypothetical protein
MGLFLEIPLWNRIKGDGSSAHADRGEVTQYSKNVQEPQHHSYDHNRIQNRLYGTRHRDKSVDESQNNTNHNQDDYHINQRHELIHLPLSDVVTIIFSRLPVRILPPPKSDPAATG